MSLMSRLMGRMAKLPPPQTRDLVITRDIPVPVPDGVTLLADHYAPRTGPKRPTILFRTPYGRSNWDYLGWLFAEQGFQFLLQRCRGTDGSGGMFHPFLQEAADSLATLEWIKRQAWFNGELALHGSSYMGYVQWALAAQAGPEVKAIAAQMCGPDIRRAIFPGEALALDVFLNWATLWSTGERSLWHSLRVLWRLKPACYHLPLYDADVRVVGHPVPFWRELLEHHQPHDSWWQDQNLWDAVPQVKAPVNLFGGWYDFSLPDMLGLYQTLRRAGQNPYLLIGPWSHSSRQMVQFDTREALMWFRAHLLGDRSGLRSSPVHIYVMGAQEWRDYPEWPPAGYEPQPWYLHQGHRLSPDLPSFSEPDRYRYDPADPTPAVGGASTLPSSLGPQDQRKLEARSDVLIYTSAPLTRDMEVIGPVQADLYVHSSLEYTDFFACLCDVPPPGRSTNITSALVRLWPEHPVPESDGCLRVQMTLWPTAYRFRRGHCIRLQVSSGAHPHFARNLGSGEALGTATTMKVAEQSLYHDPIHPSAILLPVARASVSSGFSPIT
jgi:putative CocE/NonD family hydrolase